ncbi:hypothetical protein SAMN02799622_03540 [Methylobacterium sp. UNC378MF]|uniref:hypothetical protein n=1 Tax=Methylobacterium sp. UNC378MF TaxID=1502748 RepID=UPI00088AF01E|nr:hypothetical protein [Methylobacterium sp. UNC378MF]SDA25040.1 hypothetical protein SAMN02799622_03540 [Methylobacterium sp. UNC378MF]
MLQTYKIDAALKGRGRKTLRCASAWVAYEQRDRLVRQGWTVSVLDHAMKPVAVDHLEAAALAESGNAMRGA